MCCDAALLLGLCLVAPLGAQVPADEPARVMVLGTYHFASPGRDVVKAEIADVLSDGKQAEIRDVVDALTDFRPTHVAVEREPDQGRYELSSPDPIDHPGEFPFDAVMEYAATHDPDFVTWVDDELERIEGKMNRQQRENTIGEVLRQMNRPEKLAEDHGVYMRFARVGAGDSFDGAELVSKWYERNIHIFSNIQAIAEPGARILVIIGGGHAPILRELIGYDPELRLVETLNYLPS